MSEFAQLRATLDEIFGHAKQHQSAGDLDQAQRLYGQILARVPIHAEALTMLGSIAYQKGDNIQAEAYLDRAIEVYQAVLEHNPAAVVARAPLVNLLLARNRLADAQALMPDLDLQVNPIRASAAEFAQRREAARERGLPSILVNTVPKSASESIWNRLAEGLQLSQCHLSLGLFPDCCLVPARLRFASAGGLIAKEHIPATPFNLRQLEAHGFDRVVFHTRDPRQATLSWAHFVLDDVSMRLMAPIWRKIVPPKEVLDAGLEPVIDWSIEHYLPLLVEFMAQWLAVRDDPSQNIAVLFRSFETFRVDPDSYFQPLLEFYGLDPAIFVADAEAEVVHLRKGLLEEWREVFSEGQKRRAWRKLPASLIELCDWTA